MWCVLRFDERYECWDVVERHNNPCAAEVRAFRDLRGDGHRYRVEFVSRERLALLGTQGHRHGV